jgi:CRISPR-associated protein, Csa1 family
VLFIDKLELDRQLTILREEFESRGGISDDLRGWSWIKNSRVKPLSEFKLPVSEITHRYCPTYRDIYLKRVAKISAPPSIKTIRGIAYHEVFHEVNFKIKQFIYNNKIISGAELLNEFLPKIEPYVERIVNFSESRTFKLKQTEHELLKRECYILYRYLIIQAASKIDLALSKYKFINRESLINEVIPSISEKRVDGSLVGFSRELSVDIYTPFNTIADIKTGDVRNFHRHILTAYALAIESSERIPIDFGMVVYVKVDLDRLVPYFNVDYFIIGDELRIETLEFRDKSFEILTVRKDPGKPVQCPDFCPYFTYCNPELIAQKAMEYG